MSGLDERYVLLGLRLGRHVDGLVDSYVGPQELADTVDAEPLREPTTLAEEARELGASIAADGGLDAGRCDWLLDQVKGAETYARVLAGEPLSYLDEVEGCYGVRPSLGSKSDYEEAFAELDEILPGGGALRDRYNAWRDTHTLDGGVVVELLSAVAATLKGAAGALVELPPRESAALEGVRDEPWWAFNYFLGERRSRVVINLDIQTTAADLVHLAAHEIYPGHHTERVLKEQLHIEERGWLEESVQLVPTPAALVCEGIAELGFELLVDGDLTQRLERVFAAAGVDAELERSIAIERAREPLSRAALDSAILIHVDGVPLDEARAYLEKWGLMSADRAASNVRFVTDPTWRAYGVTYWEGLQRCRAYVDGDPARFVRLLTEQVRVTELVDG